MTPKEKAVKLIESYHKLGKDFTRGVSMQEFSKECALICVNEILESGWDNVEGRGGERARIYWNLIKDELKNL